LSERIATRTGLHFPPQRHADLRREVVAAATALTLGHDA
jgi:hypothetical protein